MTELNRFYKLAERAIIANKPLRARMLLAWPLQQLEAKNSKDELINVQIDEIKMSMHDLKNKWDQQWVRDFTLITIRFLIQDEESVK